MTAWRKEDSKSLKGTFRQENARHPNTYYWYICRPTSTFNASIKKKIIEEICATPSCTYNEEQVKGQYMHSYTQVWHHLVCAAAVQRKYESMRRQWKMKGRDDFEEQSKQLSLAKKYRARRKRVSWRSIYG